ncbi:MAG: endonuclease/exonuclease/phosphatase family protein [Bacteroidales bacterium]|nr:endonuclease/exonuclease/phosphatase family protein [Bacteroidales bacterium]
MKKKKSGKDLFKGILIALNLFVAIPLLLAFLAQYVPPTLSMICTFCGLAFPYLLYANFIFIIIWLIINYRFSLISLILVLININNIDRHYQFRAAEIPEPCVNCVKVLSYNVKLFGVYDNDDEPVTGAKKKKIFDFVAEERPEIVCFQEYFYENSKKIDFPTTDTLVSILNLDENTRHFYQYFPTNLREEYFYGLAIFTKYRIIDAGPVIMTENSSNAAIYADIKFKRDTIRIYNVHLASIHMDKTDYETSKRFSNHEEDPDFNRNAQAIYRKLGIAFEHRQKQVEAICAHMDSCNHPIILCGDFNDTPASYSYNRIASKLKDTFRKSGKGVGTTYNGDAVPAYRIDYILHDNAYRSYGHRVVKEVDVSDHFPIIATISLQKSDL